MLSPALLSIQPQTSADRAARCDNFEELTLPHLAELYRTAVRILQDSSAAEDCVQETYLNARRSFRRFQQGTNCRAWLFTILLNAIRQYRRKNRHRGSSSADFETALEFTPATSFAIAEGLSDKDILDALDELPEHYRDVVILCDVQEFTYVETAGLLNVPSGTVMSRLSRGREALRVKLAAFRNQTSFRTNAE